MTSLMPTNKEEMEKRMIKEFREAFKHSQFVDYSAIEAFIKYALFSLKSEIIKRVEEETCDCDYCKEKLINDIKEL